MQFNLRVFALLGYVDGSFQCHSISISTTLPDVFSPQSSTSSILTSDYAITYVQWTCIDQSIMDYIMCLIAILSSCQLIGWPPLETNG